MQMALAEAMTLLKVPANYTTEDIIAAFRREAKKAHPDAGGTAAMFQRLVEARDRLLASLGTSAPAPRPPQFREGQPARRALSRAVEPPPASPAFPPRAGARKGRQRAARLLSTNG